MQRVATTVLVVVGEHARAAAHALGRAVNVRAVLPPADDPPLERARATLSAAAGTSSPFVVGDADPLAEVADAWVRWFDGEGARGELETAMAAALARWRGGTLELPDYYLLLDPQEWAATRRHWFLGWLHGHAPARVVPVEGAVSGLATAVGRLRAGRWWAPLDRLLEEADRVTPDELVTSAAAEGPRLAGPGDGRPPS